MTGFNPLKILGIICLTVFLLTAPQLFAQENLDDFGGLENLASPAAEVDGVSDNTITETPADDAGLGDGLTAESTTGEGAPTPEGAPAAEGAPTAEGSPAADAPKMSEQEQVDGLINKYTFATENPKKDPFKPIVEKKVVLPPVRTVQPVSRAQDNKPAAPAVKPIRLFVTGIVGNEGQRLAVVKFENNELTVVKDQIVEGKFKVVDVLADRVVIYSNKEQRRHTFKIGGEEKD